MRQRSKPLIATIVAPHPLGAEDDEAIRLAFVVQREQIAAQRKMMLVVCESTGVAFHRVRRSLSRRGCAAPSQPTRNGASIAVTFFGVTVQ